MNKYFFIIIIILFNCSTYFENRRKDFLDIFTLGVENNMYGGKVKLMPVNIGLIFQSGRKYSEFKISEFRKRLKKAGIQDFDSNEISFKDGQIFIKEKKKSSEEDEDSKAEESLEYIFKEQKIKIKDRSVLLFKEKNGFGLRGGNFSSYNSEQMVFIVGGGESLYSGDFLSNDECIYISKEKMNELYHTLELKDESGTNYTILNQRDNLKSYDLRFIKIFSDKPKERQKRIKEEVVKEYIDEVIENKRLEDPELVAQLESYRPKTKLKPFGYSKSYLYQTEFTFGIKYGIRFGFNIAELLDFLMGFTSYDLLKDDIQKTKIPNEPEKIEFAKINLKTEQEKMDKNLIHEKACRNILNLY